jgi:5-methyltetrahydrofolate--homocysteine methyltransferase
MSEALVSAISNVEEEQVVQLVQEQLAGGTDAQAVLADCRDGMAQVGKRYEAGEYYVSELIMAGELCRA